MLAHRAALLRDSVLAAEESERDKVRLEAIETKYSNKMGNKIRENFLLRYVTLQLPYALRLFALRLTSSTSQGPSTRR